MDFNDIERQASKDLKLTKPIPKCEEITQNEIYLLDENNHRISRICGYIDQETNWPCTRNAGEGTDHVGIGRCSTHGSVSGGKEYIERLVDNLSDESELYKYFDYASKSSDDYFDLDRLVRMVGAVLEEYMNRYQHSWSEKKIDRFLMMIDSWRKLIESQQKKEANRILSTTISTIIRSILLIIMNNVSQDTYSKIVNQISNINLPKEVESIEFEEVK